MLISSYQFGGKPKRILDLALSAAFLTLTSDPLRNELARVLSEKFLMPDQLICDVCTPYWQMAEWISPKVMLQICPDEAGNRVLECAWEGQADFIVTGERHLLDLKPVPEFMVLKPNAFLAFLSSSGFKPETRERF